MGRYQKLLPIVVTCRNREDTVAINMLNELIFPYIKEDDYVGLRNAFTNHPAILELLTQYDKFHVISSGQETGIWVDWLW